jgi:outer membrane protein TolC
MKKSSIVSVLVALCVLWAASAQSLLSPEEAVKIALKNNYDILVAHDDAEIAKINNTLGNAGMLPAVTLTGSENYSVANFEEQPITGGDFKFPNETSNTLNASVGLGWTLFDGGKMFVTKKKLSELEALGDIQFRDKVLQTVYDVTAAYYNVVQQKQQLASIKDVLAYNHEQVTILQTGFDAGVTTKNALLQAQIDLNVNKENEINQQTAIINSKRTLNQLLGRDTEVTFYTSDSIPLTFAPDRNQLLRKIDTGNTTIAALQRQVVVADLVVNENVSFALPRLSVNAGYGIVQNNNSAAPSTSLLMSRSTGPQIGALLSIPLYQGGNVVRQVKTAKLQLQSARYDLQNAKLQVRTLAQNALDEFENQSKLLSIEKENFVSAKENLEISMQRLRFGQSTSLELRQAEESYEDSRTRLVNIKFNLKLAETKLRQLMADL